MHNKFVYTFCLIFCLSISVPSFASELALSNALELHRKIIFLVDAKANNKVAEQRDVFIARNFYVKKRHLLADLELIITTDSRRSKLLVREFITFIKKDFIHAADVLAFIDLVDAILYQHEETPFLTSDELSYLKYLEGQIAIIQDSYQENLSEITQKLQTRGLTIEPWEAYLGYLREKYSRKKIYSLFNKKGGDLAEPAMRGAESKKDKDKIVWGYNLPKKTVVLTFDDGPHYRNTGKILDTLKKHNAHGYFFAVGRNIGDVVNGKVKQGNKSKILRRALDEGHLIANHSFSHAILTKLDSSQQYKELEKTNMLLQSVSGYSNKDFRPPYGSKNNELLSTSESLGMRAIMWNIDSMDWADPVPDSIVKRVMDKLEKDQRGILLFHDIHKQTVQALPKLLEALSAGGYKIVTIDGKAFNTKNNLEKPKIEKVVSKLYGQSWALVIGINQYEYWPKLSYAVNDAKALAKVLNEDYGFKKDNIFELYDQDASRGNIVKLLSDTLSDPAKVKPNDRVFVFYAGHGMTRSLPSGRSLGYIIPANAELNRFSSNSISMTHLQDFSDMIPAKHVYFVMDSCYSGIALTRGGLMSSSKYLSEVSGRRARQILTAGGADQEVADGGPQGHSIFTWTLLQGLKGNADLDQNHIITASELGAFIAPRVSENSNQTPVFGNLVGSEGGDFLFELAPLTNNKETLTEEEKLRQDLLLLQKENAALKEKLAGLEHKQAKNNQEKDDFERMSPQQRREKSIVLHREGLNYYKQKNYKNALESLNKALKYNPSEVSLVNDYGFILYRDGQLEESLKWLEKTIEIDAERTPVYLNIADTLAELGRHKEAIPYYQYYLSLYPKSPVKERIDEYLKAY